MSNAMRAAQLLLVTLVAVGCADPKPVNRSFPVTIERAVQVLHYDADHHRPLRRPLLVIGGFADPGIVASRLRDRFQRWTGDSRVVAVSPGFDWTMDDCRRDVVTAVDKAFPTGDPDRTTEVDVVGLSMGGVVARAAALPPGPGLASRRRLRIARLFTISSPLRGAALADFAGCDLFPIQSALRTGSWLYRRLNDEPIPDGAVYPVYSYVRLGDHTVGPANGAVPGATPWWVATPWPQLPHDAAFADARILADITCRLRGEPPFAHDPTAPFPERS
jgi:hypothetical protein